MIKNQPLKRISICECGFPLLKESIPLGTVYSTVPSIMELGATMICGGCKKEIKVDCILVFNRFDDSCAFLPCGVFQADN